MALFGNTKEVTVFIGMSNKVQLVIGYNVLIQCIIRLFKSKLI